MTSASSVHEAGHPRPVLWDHPEGLGGEVGGAGKDTQKRYFGSGMVQREQLTG